MDSQTSFGYAPKHDYLLVTKLDWGGGTPIAPKKKCSSHGKMIHLKNKTWIKWNSHDALKKLLIVPKFYCPNNLGSRVLVDSKNLALSFVKF